MDGARRCDVHRIGRIQVDYLIRVMGIQCCNQLTSDIASRGGWYPRIVMDGFPHLWYVGPAGLPIIKVGGWKV